MRKEQPGKRTDPGKLARDRAAIRKDVESREKPERKESPLELFIRGVKLKIEDRRRRGAGFGPPPRVPGALQHGFKKPDDTA